MILPAFSKTYDNIKVLDFPGLTLLPGNIYTVIGSNGSGKSTFAKIIAGILQADRKNNMQDNFTVGYLPQKTYAFRMSVKENILLNGSDEQRANALMDALQIRSPEKKRAQQLSGGETARMALARIMMKRYDLLILDEPTAAMDMESTILAEQCIAQYVKETSCALILITHSLQQARRIADYVLYFHNGSLLEHGDKEKLLYRPDTDELRQFLEFYGA